MPTSTTSSSISTTRQASESLWSEADVEVFVGSEGGQIPQNLTCPVGYCLMHQPVRTQVGSTYEAPIARWLDGHDTDPCTNLVLRDKRLTPNIPLREAFKSFRACTLQRFPAARKLFVPPLPSPSPTAALPPSITAVLVPARDLPTGSDDARLNQSVDRVVQRLRRSLADQRSSIATTRRCMQRALDIGDGETYALLDHNLAATIAFSEKLVTTIDIVLRVHLMMATT